jgi:hypothetical protein
LADTSVTLPFGSHTISSNFGKEQMANSAKSPANSLKPFWCTAKILYEFCTKMCFFCASREKAAHKLLKKLTLG